MVRTAGLWEVGWQAGDPDAVFVYEILWSDCNCGSWRNKGLNEDKMGTGGKWKAALGEVKHAHTCVGCLHWAGTLHADAFHRSWWAHQIRIRVFKLTCAHMCVSGSRALCWGAMKRVHGFITAALCFWPSAVWRLKGFLLGVTSHIFSVP